jgi:outer membrane protein OmpA-like peptidoglycan-associated protein/outer membrane protein W
MTDRRGKVKIMQTFRRTLLLAVAALGVLSVLPDRAAAQNAAPAKSGDYFNFFEFNVYGGWGNYAKQTGRPFSQLEQGVVAGARVTENFWNYFALEQDFGFFSDHKLRFRGPTPNGIPLPIFQTHVYQGSFNGVLHFTPRESKFRPFVTAGVGEANYVPTDSARKSADALPPSAGFLSFGSKGGFELNYGGGLKYQMSPRFGLRFDARGYYGRTPQFGIPSSPVNDSASIPYGFRNFGVQITGGFTMYFGRVGERPAPPSAPAPPPPPPTTQHSLNAGSISASSTSVCPGDTVRLHSDASDPEGRRLSYQWSVNGNNQGGTSADYTFTPDAAGDYRIGVHVSDTASTNAAAAVDAGSVSIHVGAYSRPTAGGLTADPSVLDRGQTSALHVNATGSECGGALTYSWAASEGTVSGSGATAQYNSSAVAFNEGDRSRPQSKQVTLTATVTDAKGGSASATGNVTVNYGAQVRHFGDIVFGKGSARVNNCGKRVLIEQLYPMLASNANFDVVLVGHIDSGEVPKTKSSKGRSLDRERVLQTAAVLSGGSGTCASLDSSRIKGVSVGATQETETLPTSCTVSTTAPKERKGAELDANEAKNRRVEIWLVPKGMSLPPVGRDAKELPETELKKIGCPK